jgi:glycosyltransferase involved in cell wall biosynthesis
MEFYLNDIHPKLKEWLPEIQLLAIGMTPEWLSSKKISDNSIHPLGFVDDIRPYLYQAMVGICPVRYGSGTRIKIMTYMAADLPVVSTAKGAEGVAYVNGRDLIITDDPDRFAKAILALLTDEDHRNAIADAGHRFICEHYDWNVIGKNLIPIYHHG